MADLLQRTGHHWEHLQNPVLGTMNKFSESLVRLETKYPNLLPDIRRGSVIFIGSDYGGQHSVAQYESLAFLFADLEHCHEWEQQRRQFRQTLLSDGRRLSYKTLGDRNRRRALFPFLTAANSIPGITVTILIDKKIESLFQREGRLKTAASELQEYSHWDDRVFEKLLRVVHWCSFFLAGLSRLHQDVLWFTDEDAIVANEERLREFVKIFEKVAGHYMSHTLGHVRIGTTKSDTGSRDIEDLVAIPDIVAGSLCEILTEYYKLGGLPSSELMLPLPPSSPKKTKEVMNWFADHTQPLKRLVYLLEEEKDSKALNLRYIRFHGLLDYAC